MKKQSKKIVISKRPAYIDELDSQIRRLKQENLLLADENKNLANSINSQDKSNRLVCLNEAVSIAKQTGDTASDTILSNAKRFYKFIETGNIEWDNLINNNDKVV